MGKREAPEVRVYNVMSDQALATMVAPGPLSPEALTQFAAAYGVSKVRSRRLGFPEVPDGAVGVAVVERVYVGCALCPLSGARDYVVFTRGDVDSGVVLMGEGPGREENARGLPFIGPSGRLQSALLRRNGVDPDAVAWLNLVGCRPTDGRFSDNRAPNAAELGACSERTTSLLKAIRPGVVVCLGREPAGLFWPDTAMPRPWEWRRIALPGGAGEVDVGFARHPSYLLRTINARHGYGEYAAARKFYRALAHRMRDGVTKVKSWTWVPRYLAQLPSEGVSTWLEV